MSSPTLIPVMVGMQNPVDLAYADLAKMLGDGSRSGIDQQAAIGYQDLVSVANTMTQIAPAISLISMVMLTYLAMSLTYSLIGNLYSRSIRFKGT